MLECSGLLLEEMVSMSMESESNTSSTEKSSFIVRLASPPTGKQDFRWSLQNKPRCNVQINTGKQT